MGCFPEHCSCWHVSLHGGCWPALHNSNAVLISVVNDARLLAHMLGGCCSICARRVCDGCFKGACMLVACRAQLTKGVVHSFDDSAEVLEQLLSFPNISIGELLSAVAFGIARTGWCLLAALACHAYVRQPAVTIASACLYSLCLSDFTGDGACSCPCSCS